MSFGFSNEGALAEYLTMQVDATTDKDFSETDVVTNNLTACVISANNEVGMGAAGDKLFGKVVNVSKELQSGTTLPVSCTVQVRGVARFAYASTAPTVGQMVEVDGAGKVRVAAADADIAAGGLLAKGQTIAADATNATCDVWLG
jgi:hypothetical protein